MLGGVVAKETVIENFIKMLNTFAVCLQSDKPSQCPACNPIVIVQPNCSKILTPTVIFVSSNGDTVT